MPIDSLHTLLSARCHANAGSTYGTIAPADLMRELVVSGLDYRGQASSGYGEHGAALTVTAVFNVGDLVAPAFVKLEGKLTATGTRLAHRLILIEHFGQTTLERSRNYAPIGMFLLGGTHGRVSVTLSAEAGVGIPGMVGAVVDAIDAADPEGLAASLDIFAGATAKVSYDGEYLSLGDPQPGFYVCASQSGMLERFQAALGEGDKDVLKKEVAGYLAELHARDVKQRGGIPLRRKWTTEDLLQALASVSASSRDPKQRTIIADYDRRLRAIRDQAAKPAAAAPPKREYDDLAFVSLTGHAGGGGASIGARFNVKGRLASAGGAINADVNAGAEGSLKLTTYRLQTWFRGPDSTPVVVTQDTTIKYHQARLGASATAALQRASEAAGLRERGWSRAKAYNLMTYQSAVAFWCLKDNRSSSVATLEGTGVSYGISVLIPRLVLASQELMAGALRPDTDSLLTTLTGRLCVTRATLEAFLKDVLFNQPRLELAAIGSDVVLLESSFDAQAAHVSPMTRDGRTSLAPNTADALHRQADAVRQAQPLVLRLRYRIADVRRNEHTRFALGPVLAGVVGFHLHAVTSAGLEGVIDLATRFYGRLSGASGKDAYDRAVPAVTLLHQ